MNDTYGSSKRGAILINVSKKDVSLHMMTGFWDWLFTFKIRNKMHIITATNAKKAVDIFVQNYPIN